MGFGSDGYVTPIAGIYAAVTRRTLAGKNPNGWIPEEKITVEQTVRTYTVNNAFFGFQGNELGSLEVNKTLPMVGGDVMYSR